MTQSGTAERPAPQPRHRTLAATPRIIAENVRRLRLALGLSVAECARAIEVVPAAWSNWESRRHPIPTTKLDEIATVLSVTVQQLIAKTPA